MKYRYREEHEMKDSGVEWLGMIPKEWNNGKFKYSITYQKGKNPKVISEEKGEGYFPYLSTGFLRTGACDTYTKIDSSLCFVKENELLLLWDGANAGEIFDSKEGIVSSTMAKLSFFDFTNKNFGKHLLKYLERPLRFSTIGMGIPHVNSEVLKNLPWNTPKVKEQQKIADFLDKKNAEFDLVIEKKEKLIEKLEEAKKSLISEVVTGKKEVQVISNKSYVIGDDGQEQEVTRYEVRNREPHEMKDSGVEWLGMIPEEWGVTKLKYELNLLSLKVESKKSKYNYIGMENIESWSGNFKETDTIVDGLSNYFEKNNILFGKLRPYLAKVYLTKNKGICSTEFLVYECNNKNIKYYHKLMLSSKFIDLINSSTYGSKMPRANSEFINNILIPNLSILEQQKIAEFLDEKTTKFDSIIQKNKDQIEKIKEAKQSLISEAVTGKIEIM